MERRNLTVALYKDDCFFGIKNGEGKWLQPGKELEYLRKFLYALKGLKLESYWHDYGELKYISRYLTIRTDTNEYKSPREVFETMSDVYKDITFALVNGYVGPEFNFTIEEMPEDEWNRLNTSAIPEHITNEEYIYV